MTAVMTTASTRLTHRGRQGAARPIDAEGFLTLLIERLNSFE